MAMTKNRVATAIVELLKDSPETAELLTFLSNLPDDKISFLPTHTESPILVDFIRKHMAG